MAPTAAASVPAQVTKTLSLIDAGKWPPDDASGTKGGTNFGNFEGRLPKKTSSGKRITYTEWDVNRREAGRSRDAERIVTGSDGSAWYTADHYNQTDPLQPTKPKRQRTKHTVQQRNNTHKHNIKHQLNR